MAKKKTKKKKYPLKEVGEPNLFRDIFPYSEVPKIVLGQKEVPMDPPKDFWITCTTFRDGQQARPPYTVKQIVGLYEFMHRLGGPKGIIRQCEFFLYSKKDREAVEKCLQKRHRYPEVTGWIRANKNDFQLVKEMGLKETGILTSCSDYHIFLKLNKDRKAALEGYLDVVRAALDAGVLPRCHLEDITRADMYGFVLPFVQALMDLADESGVPIKIRLCDTLGYGIPYPGAPLPRSVAKLVHTVVHEGGVPPERLEWHGHNDFHKVLANAAAAWLYGCAAANGTLLGFGERTGNPPIEGLVIEYIGLKGETSGMDTTVITEIAEYFQKEIGAVIPPNYPFVGSSFNTTRAGIHADGVFKNEEIYNIFDTAKLLKRPLRVTVTDKSGLAGIAYWVDAYLGLKDEQKIDKHHPGIVAIAKWVEEQYRQKRTTGISDDEMLIQARKHLPQYFESDLDRIKKKASELVVSLIKEIKDDEHIVSMNPLKAEAFLEAIVEEDPFIQFIYIVDAEGKKVTKNITHPQYRKEFETKGLDSDFTGRQWFIEPMKTGNIHVTNLYTSKITGNLCITVSAPIKNEQNQTVGILGIDLKFEDLAKL
ncbi:MAG: histone-lysine N-methyltransferase [Candidatus Omnitrophota bacterium]|nr:MAG: histone-lysine N-methyltransferase [Candidatus Omnitrophota bacterium]